MGLPRQIRTLASKNFSIALGRAPITTVAFALVLPILLTALISFAKNLTVPPAEFGIGNTYPIRSLQQAFADTSGSGRDTVIFVDGGFAGGDIDRAISILSAQVEDAGKQWQRIQRPEDLPLLCKSSLRGVSTCFGAVVFNGSPTEGPANVWNYTLRMDGALSSFKIDVHDDRTDAQLYILPLQRAVDAALAQVGAASDNGAKALPDTTMAFPYTDMTQDEREDMILQRYQEIVINWLGVLFLASLVFITYHMAGFIATEHETGMTRLLDAMMPVKRRWHAIAARIISFHLSFSALYLPGWVIGALVLRAGVFANTNFGIVIIYQILAGLALASWSILAASFFRTTQLSGNITILITIILGILAQSLTRPSTTPVVILSLLFTPCNYVYFMSFMARFERERLGADLTEVAPESPWHLSGIVLWVFVIAQIFVYPLIGALIETRLYGTATKGRDIIVDSARQGLGDNSAVRLEGFTKVYSPSMFRRLFSFGTKSKEPVRAVENLSFRAGRGQIVALLGANGSGKSTTLDAIAGMNKVTGGTITVDGTGGLGIAPQKNVFWDDLTVEQHIRIFNRLKSDKIATKQEIKDLIAAVDLQQKRKAQAKTLSGGQKRKLQLGMMLTGGSAVCCVDEVSSGLDPLSRRKIWDILLAERGRRTMILTTHFLDEADLLADHIVILSKGTLRAEGSSVQLKDTLGDGYHLRLNMHGLNVPTPSVPGVEKKHSFDVVTYQAPTSALAAQVIRSLESAGLRDYRFSGPTIEDVFLRLAEEAKPADDTPGTELLEKSPNAGKEDALKLLDGRPLGYGKQMVILLRKRITILKTNWFPHAMALLLPIVAAGLVTLYVKGKKPDSCSPQAQVTEADTRYNSSSVSYEVAVGPPGSFNAADAIRLLGPSIGSLFSMLPQLSSSELSDILDGFSSNVSVQSSFDDFNRYIEANYKDVSPGGLWLASSGESPTLAFLANRFLATSVISQNFLNVLLSNQSIVTNYDTFALALPPSTGNSLQLITYTCIALCAYPGFLALYPNVERRRQVRSLQYSNGVRPLPLWLAYILFDWALALVSSAIVVIIWAATSEIWFHVGYLFLILALYGLASIILGFVFGLFAKNQLATFAWVAAYQALIFLVYIISYLCILTYVPATRVDTAILLAHFIISAFAPIGSILRSLFVGLNVFSTACDGESLSGNPGSILLYGGPILYLFLQCIVYFGILLWADSGSVGSWIRGLMPRSRRTPVAAEQQQAESVDKEVANELVRVKSTPDNDDGLKVMHLTKAFKKTTVVDNMTFGIKKGEVFALLGPNGAGKSTTVSLIRGDIPPSRNGGDIFVEDESVTRNLAAARSHLGVCPQFDAVDQMTVREHLQFYASVRGIADVEHNVSTVLRAVGLEAFQTRMANALSGGNKRKLSLAIALMGNPTVVILDEPSSGLDAAAKRIMWRTLQTTVPGRSILLTTHSMEEADALAGRIGIMAKRMLAMGTVDQLRQRFGDVLYVHLVSKTAPRTSAEEMERLRVWVRGTFSMASVEDKMYHGQLRFSVPASGVVGALENAAALREAKHDEIVQGGLDASRSAIGRLVVLLEENKEDLGIEYYSVSPTTLDQVFLTIVGQHNIQEENYEVEERSPKTKRFGVWPRKSSR